MSSFWRVLSEVFTSRRTGKAAQHEYEKHQNQRSLEKETNNSMQGLDKYASRIFPLTLRQESGYNTSYDDSINYTRTRPYFFENILPVGNEKSYTNDSFTKNCINGMHPIQIVEIDPNNDTTILNTQIGATVVATPFGGQSHLGSPATNGNYNSLRVTSMIPGDPVGVTPLTDTTVTAASAFSSTGTGDNTARPTPMPNSDSPISKIIKHRNYKGKDYYYFPNLGNKRLKKLLSDLNAYVISRGRPDVKFYNFGVMRDVDAAMRGGAGRSKGSNHGFGLAIDALVDKDASVNINGTPTPIGNIGYHDRNRKAIQDHELMKILYDFSQLPAQGDVRWGAWFKRGTAETVPDVGTIYTMELHHWEIAPKSLEDYFSPIKDHLSRLNMTVPTNTKSNLALMQALWDDYVNAGQKTEEDPDDEKEDPNKTGE